MSFSDSGPLTNQQQFGSSGVRCSKIGLGTGSSRMSDVTLPDVDVDESVSGRSSVEVDAWFPAALALGINVFELGCVASEPNGTLHRFRQLVSCLPMASNAQPPFRTPSNCPPLDSSTASPAPGQSTSARSISEFPEEVLVIFRFSLRQLSSNPVDLEYRFRSQSIDEIVALVQKQLGSWLLEFEQVDFSPRQIKVAWVWDDIDFRNEVTRGCRQQTGQLLQSLLSKAHSRISLQGIGGFRWQSLAELVGVDGIDFVLLHAAGLLGPDLDAGLIPICRRQGIGIITTLPAYGGLLIQPGRLSSDHPTPEDQRLAAETARIVAEEHGISLSHLAGQASLELDVDCCLFEHPVAQSLEELIGSFSATTSKRAEALVTRHLRSIDRNRWYE